MQKHICQQIFSNANQHSEFSTSISWTEAKRELEDLLKDQKSLSEEKIELQKQVDRECRFYYPTGL